MFRTQHCKKLPKIQIKAEVFLITLFEFSDRILSEFLEIFRHWSEIQTMSEYLDTEIIETTGRGMRLEINTTIVKDSENILSENSDNVIVRNLQFLPEF